MEKEELQYYYVNHQKKSVGPFTLKEFLSLQLNKDTLIWFTGQKEWRPLSDFDFLQPSQPKNRNTIIVEQPTNYGFRKRTLYVIAGFVLLAIIIVCVVRCGSTNAMHSKIIENSHEDPELFSYLEKFYRDMEYFGISKRKSRSVCIKMAPMQYFEDTKDIHGVSFGYNNDDIIEIYINEDSWKTFNAAQRYALMYHELAHDILNVDDLPNTSENYDKLMSPVMSRFDHLTMDQFIDMSHDFFREYRE